MTEALSPQDNYCQAGVVLDNLIMAKQVQSEQKFYSEVSSVFHYLHSSNFYRQLRNTVQKMTKDWYKLSEWNQGSLLKYFSRLCIRTKKNVRTIHWSDHLMSWVLSLLAVLVHLNRLKEVSLGHMGPSYGKILKTEIAKKPNQHYVAVFISFLPSLS